MKLSILIAGLVLFTGNAAFAAKCTEAQKAKGGKSENLADGGWFSSNEPKWVCVMPSQHDGEYITITPNNNNDEE